VIFHLEEISEEKIQNIKDIRQINPKLIILLVIKHSCQSIQLLQDLGIQGIVFDDIEQDSFRNIVNKLYEGDIIIDEQIRELLIKGVIYRSERHSWNITKDSIKKELTQREEEILSLITEGMSSPEISIKLNISKDTVNFHRKNILSKFHVYGVKNTAGLVGFVSKYSII
jgi:DNA-binding NarL/FixJ family response regulator